MTAFSWNEQLMKLPGTHFLQTTQWAEIKQPLGWSAEHLTWEDAQGNTLAAAQLLVRTIHPLPIGLEIKVGYISRGPLMDWRDPIIRKMVLDDLRAKAKERRLIFLKIDPCVELGRGIPSTDLETHDAEGIEIEKELNSLGWLYSPNQIQFKNTVILDLTGCESDWLARMKQKTRYNLRLAQKSGVNIRVVDDKDLNLLYGMYAETAHRDGFIIRPEEYYLTVWKKFMDASMAEGLLAEVDGKPVAGLVYFYLDKQAWYVYGMSTGQHRDKMPNYLLQWEAMRSASYKGCEVYDLWGAPDRFDPSDAMYGVYRFKEGLGGKVVRTIGAWDLPMQPLAYQLYHQVIPRILNLTRRIRRKQIQNEVQ